MMPTAEPFHLKINVNEQNTDTHEANTFALDVNQYRINIQYVLNEHSEYKILLNFSPFKEVFKHVHKTPLRKTEFDKINLEI